MATGKSNNVLTHSNRYKLCRALERMKAELESGNLSSEDIAEQMTEKLKFLITSQNVRAAADIVGVRLPYVRSPGSVLDRQERRLRIDALEVSMDNVWAYLDYLYEKLGIDGNDVLVPHPQASLKKAMEKE